MNYLIELFKLSGMMFLIVIVWSLIYITIHSVVKEASKSKSIKEKE